MPLSDQDRDLMIRTVIGEAGDQPPDGQAAVAHVIMNRTATGQWGKTPSSVVLAPHQFEPWSTRARELVGISPQSRQYQRVGQIVDSVASGASPDNTSGATHFLDPGIVKARRGGSLPDWAQGPSIAIGDHNFYQPGNPNYGDGGLAAINAAIGAKPAASKALAYTDDSKASAAPVGSLFTAAGFDVPTKSQVAPTGPAAPAVTAPAAPAGSLFKDAGFALPGDKPAAPVAPAAPAPQMIGNRALEPWEVTPGAAAPVQQAAPVSTLQAIHQAIDPSKVLGIGDPIQNTKDAFSGALSTMAQGSQEYRSGNPYPSFPSSDPKTWGAGGLINYGTGLVGAATSPISGALKTVVSDPITQLTGDPTTGERAGALAGFAIPGAKTAQVAKAALPSSKAIDTIVNAIGPENVPAAVARLAENPRLSVMDVSDPVRTMAQGLIDPAQPKAQNILTQAVKERMAGAPAAVNEAYTQEMGPAPNTMAMVEGLKERARAAGREAITPALANAKPVDVSPVIKAIDNEVRPGMTALLDPGTQLPLSPLQQELVRFKSQLTTGNEQAFDANRLHEIQSQMGDKAYQLSISPDPKDRMLGSQLRGYNEKLIDQIDQASGGTYRPARALFKDAKDIHEAFDSGFDTLKNRAGVSGLEDRPEAFKAWMDQATPEEVVARRLGTRADIDQKINGVRNPALAGTTITKIPYNRQKLEMLFGQDEAGRLIRRMEDASDQAATNAKLIAGSKTAETLAAQKALEVPKVEPFHLGSATQTLLPSGMAEVAAEAYGAPPGLVGASLLAGGVGLGLAKKGIQNVKQSSALARNVAIARAASSTGAARQETIGALLAHPKVVRALQKSSNALTVP